ncbi:hypothetical protein C8J57DRAFT_1231392 [Mycena rebaudengoi]|nr:hypothetical protein C8J57DRAFT_1231392 [Mycena rebaudengoi]
MPRNGALGRAQGGICRARRVIQGTGNAWRRRGSWRRLSGVSGKSDAERRLACIANSNQKKGTNFSGKQSVARLKPQMGTDRSLSATMLAVGWLVSWLYGTIPLASVVA